MTTHDHLINELTASGRLPAAWAGAFAAVDRALFVPPRIWFDDDSGTPQPIDRDAEPDRWQAAVYSDEPVVTQLDHGETRWPHTSRRATSSASQPSMVATMLDQLDVHDGDRVLEIGTGTGYNAALLAERLGDDHVTTIEVDPALAEQARANLTAAGCKATVVCGDGSAGWAAGAPFDRIISTAAVIAGALPHAWIEQVRPGGVILTPWGTAYRNGALVRLTVQPDGTATGPVVGDAAFMRLRAQETAFGHAARLGDVIDSSTTATTSSTTVPPEEVAVDPDGVFAVGLQLPLVQRSVFYDDPERYEVLLFDVPTESVASVQITPENAISGGFPVRQHGPRRLWDEAETAYTRWVALGRPSRTRYGLTVTAEHQVVWVDDPANVIASFD